MFTKFALTSLLALGAAAAPMLNDRSNSFTITVKNECANSLTVASYQMLDFVISQVSSSQTVAPGGSVSIPASYTAIGMRVSALAGQSLADQWLAQSLFEFGYSAFNGLAGTAYDLSLMEGSALGMQVIPANSACETKTCTLEDCPADQGWTNENQVEIGSPADTTCMYGATDFTLIYCPS